MDRKLKTISYRRCVWFDDDEKKLETFIRKAHAKRTTVKLRKFLRAGGQYVKCLRQKVDKGGGCYLHLVAETPGDHASTLAVKDEEADESDVGTAPPPDGTEFMDGDLFAYVNGNHICLCSTVIKEGAFQFYCDAIFRKAKLGDGATQFEFQKIANVGKLKLIQAEGVKEIDLNASVYDATTKYLARKRDTAGAITAAAKHLKALFWKDSDIADDALQIGLTLRSDGRMKTGLKLGEKRLEMVAKDLIEEDDDDYVIITKKGQRIRPREVYVREKVEIEKYGKSVKRDKAWPSLLSFYGQLKKSGVVSK